MLNRIGFDPVAAQQAVRTTSTPTASKPGSAGFAGMLDRELHPQGRLRFSAHALARMEARGIQLSPGDHVRLANAVDAAAQKGARQALLLMEGVSLVVNVPNRTVITAVAPEGEEPAVFTNIDSAVVLPHVAPPERTVKLPILD